MKARPFVRRLGLISAAAFVGVALLALLLGFRAFGHAADGARRARIERSPQFHEGKFANPEPITTQSRITATVGAERGLPARR